jgi:thioredoxin 1
MKVGFLHKWLLAATAATLTIAGLVSLCWLTPMCRAATAQNKTAKGEETMTISTQTARTVEHANDTNFDEAVLRAEEPVLVDFYADWCGPCRMIAPVLEELAQETPDAKIVKVNVDHSPETAARYGISSIPSLLVFRDGEIVAEQVGLASKSQLKSMLGN